MMFNVCGRQTSSDINQSIHAIHTMPPTRSFEAFKRSMIDEGIP